jgi:Cupredoxin-like domain
MINTNNPGRLLSMIQRLCQRLALCVLVLLMISCTTTDTAAPSADITITEQGCTTASFALPASREPHVSIINQSNQPMVFSIPTMNRWEVLAPQQQATFELPRYIMGSFDFFCLTEAAHTSVGGGNPYLCLLDPKYLKPVALSAGLFEIQPHNRIQEVLHPTPALTAP